MDSGWVGIQVPCTEPGTHSRQVDSSSQSWRSDHSSGGNEEEVDMWLGPGMISQQCSLLWEGCILSPALGSLPGSPHTRTLERSGAEGGTRVSHPHRVGVNCALLQFPRSACGLGKMGTGFYWSLEAAEAQHKLNSLGRSGLVWGGKAHELHSPSLRGSLD